jgi:ectoine hydroxylase-related dioxygenase (phytanoyl-CoA dioxygenase family)
MEYLAAGRTLRYQVSNRIVRGDDVVLLDNARDLTHGLTWSDSGYTIETLFTDESKFSAFIVACRELLYHCWRKAGIEIPDGFSPEHYHQLANDQATHRRAIEETRLLSLNEFPVPVEQVTDRVSAILGRKVVGLNPYEEQRAFHFRVVRPRSGDNNPLHRDVWLEDYSNCINLYIPIAGSNANSSLILLAGSHRWPESRIFRTVDGAIINGVKFNVPAVDSIEGEFEAVRPDPRMNQFLLFSPYLIHGGAVNFNEDVTRISIELRLWQA